MITIPCLGAHGRQMSIMSIYVWWSWCLVFVTTPMTSHVGDLDAGVTADRAPLGSRRSLVSNFPRQGAVAAVAAQVSPVAAFGAEPCWRLEQKTQLVSLVCTFSIFKCIVGVLAILVFSLLPNKISCLRRLYWIPSVTNMYCGTFF